MAQDQNTLAHFPFISGYQCASPPRGATSQPVVRGSGWPAAAPLRFVRVTHVRRATDPAPAARAYAGTRRKQASPAGRPSQRSYVPGRLHLRMRCVCACLSYMSPLHTYSLCVPPLSHAPTGAWPWTETEGGVHGNPRVLHSAWRKDCSVYIPLRTYLCCSCPVKLVIKLSHSVSNHAWRINYMHLMHTWLRWPIQY